MDSNKNIDGVSRSLIAECAELLSIHDSGGGSREGFAANDLIEILERPEIDVPQEMGHAIPQWIRKQFDAIELGARSMGAEAVFTQMRTKVQAYFEMLRTVERGKAGKYMFMAGSARINAAQKMLEALQNLENDAGQIPDHAWDLCQQAIVMATAGENNN